MSLSSLHYTNTLPVHAPALSPSHLFHCSQCCNMRLMCAFVLLLHLAFTLLWPARQQLTKFTVYSCRCRLSHTVSTFVGLFGVFFLASCCFRFLSVVLIQLCLRCHNIQFPLDSGGFMVNTAQRAQHFANTVFYLPLKKDFKLLRAFVLHSYWPAFSSVVVTCFLWGLHLCLQKQWGHILQSLWVFTGAFARCVLFTI